MQMSLQRERNLSAPYRYNQMIFNKSYEHSLLASAKQPATKKFMRFIEDQAGELREIVGVGPNEVLNPYMVARRFHVSVKRPDEITSLSPAEIAEIERMDAKIWSAGAVQGPNGSTLVILNPNQTAERARVSLLEDLAHIYFKHQPSKITTLPNGLPQRSYDPRVEQEAYWTAAAALLPALVLAKAVWRQQALEQIAASYGASVELAAFRLKTLQLWFHRKS
jgi:hypothetical protein